MKDTVSLILSVVVVVVGVGLVLLLFGVLVEVPDRAPDTMDVDVDVDDVSDTGDCLDACCGCGDTMEENENDEVS
jgi:hypothetical protein